MIFKYLLCLMGAITAVRGDVGGKATVPMISAAIPGTNYYPHGLHGRDNYARNLQGFGVYDGLNGGVRVPNPYNPILQQYNVAPRLQQEPHFAPYTDYQTADRALGSPGYAGLGAWTTDPYNRNLK